MVTKPKNKKVLIGIIAAAILLLGLVFGSITIAGNTPDRRVDKYLDLGDKYLSELDYEQALVAYRQVLEIEPKNLAAYKGGLAAYAGLGDHEGMAEFYTDALGVIESMTEKELEAVYDTAVQIYLYADAVYTDDHEAAAQALERGYDTLGGDERIPRALIAEYGILAGVYIDAGDYEKEQEIYRKIVEKNLENSDALSAWEQRVRERFQEYLSKNSGSGNAPNPTPAPTAEPTPEPILEPTPEPTAEPTPEPTPEPVRYVEELFTVSENEYESYGYAYGGSIPVKKGGKWGAVNYENKVIVPFEYDDFRSADNQGRFVLYKSIPGSFAKEDFLFDNQGRIIYQGEVNVIASGGMYITSKLIGDSIDDGVVEFYHVNGSVLASVKSSLQTHMCSFYDGICYVDVGWNIGMVDLQGNITWREKPKFEYYYPKYETYRSQISPISTINHGYCVFDIPIKGDGDLLCWDEENDKIAEFNYCSLSVDENGKITMDESHMDWGIRYRGYFVDGHNLYNYGSKMVFIVGEKNVLIDLVQTANGAGEQLDLDKSVLAVYDYISMADEKYWLVQSGENWGYIDLEGRERAMYEDAGEFWKGYAVIKDAGEAWLIDENFQKLQNLGTADGVSTWGENYMVRSGGKYHFYRLVNQ